MNKAKNFTRATMAVVVATMLMTGCQQEKVAEVKPVGKSISKLVEMPIENVVVSNKTANGITVREGAHYTKLANPIELEGLADNSVLEIFWLGCPHCQNFEKGLIEWKKTKTSSMTINKMHAVSGNPRWIMDAHIYNTFDLLSKSSESVMEGLFDLYINQYNVYKTAIQADPNTEEKPFPSIKLISEFAKASGIDEKVFTDTFQSEEIKAKVKSDGDVFVNSEIQGVPAFIVNKQYMVTGVDAKSHEDYFQIVEKVAELTKK